ncbi:MAG TPA: aldehyde dehydrogenase family protein [Deltaproteobacteria bacterium]|nr:aldehyde dehydrogenase family protein [Deltaproteobacteria bacterium]HCP48383.1 aldehyde dehydrogenase family protein [Deltaproteobacteria bacterium]
MNYDFLTKLALDGAQQGASHGQWLETTHGETVRVHTPIDGTEIGAVHLASRADYEQVVSAAQAAFTKWRMVPAPQRGELIRRLGEEFRANKKELGALISLEMGKIRAEGEGEVQECIDIFDFAVGLSRQLYGLTMHSERPDHRMYEQWHPMGVIGIITAFNFPMAVWAWNAAIAAVCGDTMIWKPSLKTPLCAIAIQKIVDRVFGPEGHDGVMCTIVGTDSEVGETMIHDKRLPLISATGSCRMGRHVGTAVAGRLGRCLLELGGNNAIVVDDTADEEIAVRGILFGAVGTAGQRCTSTRRVLASRPLARRLADRLAAAYQSVAIGDPLEDGTLMGPLIDQLAVDGYLAAVQQARDQGGEVLCGGKALTDRAGFYVEPTIVWSETRLPISREETFAPILYITPWDTLEQAIADQNDADQGLSSAIFTRDLLSAEQFLGHAGSDCGIANVNIGTSGAEIGGAFGGEKDTGGGREAGSDSWKAYMRRQTCTINHGQDLPLAQGIQFG